MFWSTSYNLLQMEEELFTSQKFATIVLDEAQAIKNRTTKRSKTVMNLQGDFRLITTGTPIENHLGRIVEFVQFYKSRAFGKPRIFLTKNLPCRLRKNKDEDDSQNFAKINKAVYFAAAQKSGFRRFAGENRDNVDG